MINGIKFKHSNKLKGLDEVVSDFDDGQCLGNKVYQLFNLRRLHMGGEDWIRDYVHLLPYHWTPERFNKLFRSFLDELVAEDLYDYTRLLEELVDKEIKLSGDILIIDEAQDLSPLQMSVVKKLFPNFEYVIFAGDVDQSIFEWAGADPRLMLHLEADKKINLTQSYRLPEAVCQLAKKVIEKNTDREPVDYKPTKNQGLVNFVEAKKLLQVIDNALRNNERVFILARHKHLLYEHKKLLEKRGIECNDISRIAYSDANVFLGTIHKAKGLEAENVVLDLRVSGKVIDHIRVKGPESERRVLYVGITRSKDKLFLMNSGHLNATTYRTFLR